VRKSFFVGGTKVVERRSSGEFEGRAFFLNSELFDWKIGYDLTGTLCLVPLKKKGE